MSNLTKTDKIYNKLRSDILSWQYKPGEMLMHEEDMALSLGVARGTLRTALAQLEKDNLIVRIKRKGTFVSENIVRPKITFFLPCAEALSGNNKFISEAFYGALEASQELNCELETRAVSPTNNPDDINWARLFNLDENSKLIIDGVWFERIFPFLKEKKCQVVIIYDKTPYSIHDDLISSWHRIEKKFIQTGIDMIQELLSRGVKRPALILNDSVSYPKIFEMIVNDLKLNIKLKTFLVKDDKDLDLFFDSVKKDCIDGLLSIVETNSLNKIITNLPNMVHGVFDFKQRNINYSNKNLFYSNYDYKEIGRKSVEILLNNSDNIIAERVIGKIFNS